LRSGITLAKCLKLASKRLAAKQYSGKTARIDNGEKCGTAIEIIASKINGTSASKSERR